MNYELKYIHEEKVHNITAATIVVPLILNLLKPRSVLDVGCGIGTWMSAFSKNGIKDIIGVDGDYVDRKLLEKYIPIENFKSQDLEKAFNLNRKFDLVVSLEVAEHLQPSSADDFIDSLVRHGDTVLFSAAVPGQGGQRHLNEQWLSFWAAKFESRGFESYDPIRPIIWDNQNIETWYRQNMVVFSSKPIDCPKGQILNKILPDMWESKIDRIQSLDYQLSRIRGGKVGLGFYLKGLIKSITYFGRKQK